MTQRKQRRTGPLIAVSKSDAAASLSMSIDSFERYVMPEIRCIRKGSLRLYLVKDLERWADDNADLLYGDDRLK